MPFILTTRHSAGLKATTQSTSEGKISGASTNDPCCQLHHHILNAVNTFLTSDATSASRQDWLRKIFIFLAIINGT